MKNPRFVTQVEFKRSENSEWEAGIGIGNHANNLDIIVDINNKKVPDKQVHDFRPTTFSAMVGSDGITFNLDMPAKKLTKTKGEK